MINRTTKYYSSTTPYYKVLLQYYSVLHQYYKVVLQYYCSTTKYYSSTTPYYKRTTKYYSSTTPYYKVLLQYYSVLQSSTKASKTIISCETSSTFQGTSFQNEHFARDFLNFSSNEAYKTSISCEASSTFQATKRTKRAFRARLLQLLKQGASKVVRLPRKTQKMTSPLESLKRQNEHFVRDFLQISHFQLENRRFRASFLIKPFLQSSKSMTFAKLPPLFRTLTKCCACHDICRGCHVCPSLPLRFVETAPSPRHKMLRRPRHRERPPQKVRCLPRKNDALALTRFQSIAPVTQNAKTTSH